MEVIHEITKINTNQLIQFYHKRVQQCNLLRSKACMHKNIRLLFDQKNEYKIIRSSKDRPQKIHQQ